MIKTRVYEDRSLAGLSELTIDSIDRVHYLTRVLRLRRGDQLVVFDNQQAQYLALVEQVHKKAIMISLHEELGHSSESPLRIHLGQAISRGQRMNYTVQKATELGVSSIVPLHTEHCQVSSDKKKTEHWSVIARQASEQSGRVCVPEIGEAQTLSDWLGCVDEQVRLVLHERSSSGYDFARERTPESLALLIGPEGGLSQAEVELAAQHGFFPLQLGPRILRTETAAPVAIALAQWHWGDFRG